MNTSPLKNDSENLDWMDLMRSVRPPDFAAPQDMRISIESLDKLPPLPEIGRRMLELKGDRLCDVDQLVKAINLEPSVATQVLRWANSPLYGSRGSILSLKDAINRVLGFQATFDLVLGLASLSPLNAPAEGLLGKRFFWRQTLAGSALIQKLAALLPRDSGIRRDELHLVYLLHNAGHLLVAHLFPDEFSYLRLLARSNPELALIPLERYAWNIDHGQLGAWLMQTWKLPERIGTVCKHHHNPYYRGEEEALVWLTCLTDRLLGRLELGDACGTDPEETPLYDSLGISREMALECLDAVKGALVDLDRAVGQLL